MATVTGCGPDVQVAKFTPVVLTASVSVSLEMWYLVSLYIITSIKHHICKN